MRTGSDEFHRDSFATLWSTWKQLVYNYGRGLVGRDRHPLRRHLQRLETRLGHHAARISSQLSEGFRTVTPFTHSDMPLDYFDSNFVYMVSEFDELCIDLAVQPNNTAPNGTLAEEDEKALIAAIQAGERHAKQLLEHGRGLLRAKHVHLVDMPRFAHAGDEPLPWPDAPIVGWDRLTASDLDRVEQAVVNASREADLQGFLEANPAFLIQHLRGGHGRWVISQQRLGCEHVTDFILGERSSVGMEWHPVELESPAAKLFTKSGDPSATLNHAIRQVMDWRRWLSDNLDYARRPREQNGLGLIDIHPKTPALILLGRAASLNTELNRRRQDLMYELSIEIRTYDSLVENTRGRLVSRGMIDA